MSRRGYSWAGVYNGIKTLYLWGTDIYPKSYLQAQKANLHNMLMRKDFFSNLDLRPERLDELLSKMDSFKPDSIVGFTTSIEIAARHAIERTWRPHGNLSSIIVGAETLTSLQRELIEEAFGCKVYESYGSREFMLMAMECEAHTGLHVSMENLLVEIAGPGGPCPPGESGKVLITDLHNFATAFIRYENGDMARWSRQSSCPCGRNLPLLESIDGRTLDIIRGLDGRPLTGSFFPHLFKEYPEVRQFQAVQTAPGMLTIRVVPQSVLPRETEEEIKKQVLKVLPGMNIRIDMVDELEKTSSGKTRVTIGLRN